MINSADPDIYHYTEQTLIKLLPGSARFGSKLLVQACLSEYFAQIC